MITLSIGESRPKKWKPIAAAIKAVECTDHTHSFASYKDPRTGIRAVAEARGSGCRVVTNHHFKDENYVVRIFQYKITPEQLIKYEHYIWEQLGRPYAKKQLLGLLLMRTGATSKNPFKDGDYSQICVELSAKGIAHALGIELPAGIEDWGLREMHAFNMHMFSQGMCELATPEKLRRINGE